MRLLVNWERYAQLTGQAILPVALWLLWLTADWGRGRGVQSALASGAHGPDAWHKMRDDLGHGFRYGNGGTYPKLGVDADPDRVYDKGNKPVVRAE